jgi:hypothetical protein
VFANPVPKIYPLMKKFGSIIIMMLFSAHLFAQEGAVNGLLDEFLFGRNNQDSLLEAVLLNEADINELLNAVTTNRFIYARSEFENKTYFSGQDLGIDQYNISNQVYYLGPKGLNIAVAGILYSGFKPKYNTTIASIGYNKSFSGLPQLRIRAIYNRFFFAKTDSIADSDFNSSFNLGVTYQNKYAGTSADISLLAGNDPSFQASWDIFADITILKLGLFSRLKFSPELSMYFGNKIVVSSQYIQLPRHSAEIITQDNTFGLMNTLIRLPVSLIYRNFDFRAGYNFNFPRSPGSDTRPSNTSFFNLSVGYIFDF